MNNIRKTSKFVYKYSDLLLIVIFNGILILKTLLTEITYDEAYTFLNYVITDNVFNIGIANNHLLNTLLMWVTTQFSYSELFIRLPNLISGIIYSYYVYLIFKHKQYKYLGYSIFLTNPYILDYFTIARGYGLSVLLIFLSSFFYLETHGKRILLPVLLIVLATLSYHPLVIFLIIFWVFNIKNLKLELSNIKFILISFLLCLYIAIIVYILFNITSTGKPLFGTQYFSLPNLIFTGFGFEQLYISNNYLITYLSKMIFFLPLLLLSSFKYYQKKFLLISYCSVVLLYLIPFILEKPYPLLRAILPFIPPFLFLFYYAASNLFNSLKREYTLPLIIIIISTLSVNAMFQVSLYETINWKGRYNQADIIARSENSCEYIILTENLSPVGEYYRFIDSISKNDC